MASGNDKLTGSPPPRGGRRFWRPFLTRAEKAQVLVAVAEQNRRTSGEIQVSIVAYAGAGDILGHARRRFAVMKMDKLPERNGILILISRLDRRFAIWGDEALHARAGHCLWDEAAALLTEHLIAGFRAEGIEACVRKLGDELASHFPMPSAED